MEKSRGRSISWSSRETRSRRREQQRSSNCWQPAHRTESGRTSAGRRRPTGALPGFQLRLRRTKTAYKVDKISESFSAKRKTFDRVGLVNHQQSWDKTGQIGVQLASSGEYTTTLLRNFIKNISLLNEYKKAELPQRWPRDAPYIGLRLPWEIFDSPWVRLLFQKFLWAFVPIDAVNVHTKFEVRSFIRSWDIRGYFKKLGSAWIRPRPFSPNI